MPGHLCQACSEWVPFDAQFPNRLHICAGVRTTPKLGKFTCASCTREFIHPSLLNSHECGALAAVYQTSNGPKKSDEASVAGQCYCPACARPFLARKAGGNNRTPAHNIISRDALKLTGAIKDSYGVQMLNDKNALQVNSFGNVLLVFFVMHFEAFMTASNVPLYRNSEVKDLWPAVVDFLDHGGRDFLYSAGNDFPFGLGDGDRDSRHYCHTALLDRLFGTLCQAKKRRVAATTTEWDVGVSNREKMAAIFTAVANLAPSDSYGPNYCQKGLDAQCGTCESRQGEANLLCRYFAAKDAIGKLNNANVRLRADSIDLLNFVGLQFCCNDKGEASTSLSEVSERWLTKATVWQLYRHLNTLYTNLKTEIFGTTMAPIATDTPIPVVLETLYHNWRAFSLFYTLSYLRLAAGDYDDAFGRYALGRMSSGLQVKLLKADDKAADQTSDLNVQARRFKLRRDGGATTGGVACALPVSKW